jgi:LmbE family N-acetylglucosaminyl deacetylase
LTSLGLILFSASLTAQPALSSRARSESVPSAAVHSTPAATVAPCRGTSMYVVAHQDDDILFINPDLHADIKAGRCIVTLYLTAGDAGRPAAHWRGREVGAMAAYATMAGVPSRWTHRSVTLAGHPVTRVALVDRNISLVFLRLPDGHGYANHDWETLAKLWRSTIPAVHSIDSGAAYTKTELLDVISDAMRAWHPDVVRTLDYSSASSRDHTDHLTVGYFTFAAHLAYSGAHRFYGYRGYPISASPANLSRSAARAKIKVFLAYAQHDAYVCRTEKACRKNRYWPWLSRQYRTTGPFIGARP